MSHPNPMHSRCGLEDCFCEFTIGGLLRRLELIAENCTAGLHPLADKDRVFRHISYSAKYAVKQTRDACIENLIAPCGHGLECPCYQAGYEAERQPC